MSWLADLDMVEYGAPGDLVPGAPRYAIAGKFWADVDEVDDYTWQLWLNVGEVDRITWQVRPYRVQFDGRVEASGGFELDPSFPKPPAGPRVMHLVLTPHAGLAGTVFADDGLEILAEAGAWRVQVGVESVLTGAWVSGDASVLTVVSDGSTAAVYMNAVPQGSMVRTATPVPAPSFLVAAGLWDLHMLRMVGGIPVDLNEQMAELVAAFPPHRRLAATVDVTVTAFASVTDSDPWADIPIPDPEEPGGALIPPEVPEPVEPPDSDW